MIKNDRQYQAAKRAAEEFARTIAKYPESPPPQSDIHPRLWVAERDAMARQLEELREDLRTYDELRTGQRRVLPIRDWTDVPRALIEGRIAAGLSQRDLADRLGLAEQAVQRYEASDYASASLTRLTEIAAAIGLSLAGVAAMLGAEPTVDRLIDRAKELGLSKDWFAKRLLPPPAAAAIFSTSTRTGRRKEQATTESASGSAITGLVQAADVFRRVFQIEPEQLFGSAPLVLNPAVVGQTRFKRPTKTPAKGADAYTFYAHYLALLTLAATVDLPKRPLPRSAKDLRRVIRDRFGALSFETSLRFSWSYGIPVLPLSDSGAFHGACWRTGGRDVIVLKQRTPSEDRWTYDLWHEIGHIADDPDSESFAFIEEAIPPTDDPRERAAMAIAGDVVLDGKADQLAERAMELVDNNVPLLARVVPRVAADAGVSPGALANHLAYRIAQDSHGKINWWGSAMKLQRVDRDPWLTARDVLIEHLDFGRLNPADRDLLVRALSEPTAYTRADR